MATQPLTTYGNWKRPTSPGILGLGLIGTCIMAVHLIISVFIFMQSFLVGIIWFTIGGICLYLVVHKDKHNMSILYRILLKYNFMRQKQAKRNIYISGPLSLLPNGHFRLPSIAANTSLVEFLDPQNKKVSILVHNNRFVTLVLKSEPEGFGLLDQEKIEQRVGQFGAFLNNLNNEPGLVSVSCTIETEPESGLKLKNEINNHLVPTASELSRKTLKEIEDTYPAYSAAINSYTAFTYSLQELNADKRPVVDILREIVSRLPLLASALQNAGSSVCKPITSEQIFRCIRTAYDPNTQTLFDITTQENTEIVDWDNVGPSIAINDWDKYTTDSAVHRTYVMSQAPRGVVVSNVLERLLQPHQAFVRKRVTMIYKPMSFEESAHKVESDLTNAQFKANSEKRPTARQQIAVQQAVQTATEEARGTSLIRFGMVVTISVPTSDDLVAADAIINNLAAASHIVLRSANGTQDTAFIAGLPLGLVLDNFYSTFDVIKEQI